MATTRPPPLPFECIKGALGMRVIETILYANPTLAVMEPTFDAILDRFIEDERMMEIKQSRPGEHLKDGDLSYSTVISYLSVIKRVRAKWGTTRITRM